jgi:hypothetical protein
VRTLVVQGHVFHLQPTALGRSDSWIVQHDETPIGMLRRKETGQYEVLAPRGSSAETRGLLRLVREAVRVRARDRATAENVGALVDGVDDEEWE